VCAAKVRKLGDRVLGRIIPILKNGVASGSTITRRGVCAGIKEVRYGVCVLFYAVCTQGWVPAP